MYLVIPDSLAELQAVSALVSGTTLWIGVDDLVTEGIYLTVQGSPATFLPWDNGEPTSLPAEADCVQTVFATRYANIRCTITHAAVCECEP